MPPDSNDMVTPDQLDHLEKIYQQLHAAPELSHFEEKTGQFMAARLRALGYAVTDQFGHYENPHWTCHGVVALLKNGPGPTVLYRADMDALPVQEQTGLPYASRVAMRNENGEEVPVMHACGHDLHCTLLLGVAAQMQQRAAQWSGTLMLVVQPAEESTDTGAAAMLRAGLYEKFARPDYVIAFHSHAGAATGTIHYVSGYAMADVTSLQITIYGHGGHGAAPHLCKDPIVLAAEIILALQTIVSREIDPMEPAVITVGAIHGGHARNIIPEEVSLELTVRCYQRSVRKQIIAAIRRITTNLGRAAGMQEDRLPVVKVLLCGPAVYNDPDLTSRAVQVFRRVLGEESVKPTKPVMGAEDFALYGMEQKIPSAMFWLGAVAPERIKTHEASGTMLPQLHAPEYAIDVRPALRTGIKAATSLLLDLLQQK